MGNFDREDYFEKAMKETYRDDIRDENNEEIIRACLAEQGIRMHWAYENGSLIDKTEKPKPPGYAYYEEGFGCSSRKLGYGSSK